MTYLVDDATIFPCSSNPCRYRLTADLSRNDEHELKWRYVLNLVALIITVTLVETIGRCFCLKGIHRYAGSLYYVRAEDIPLLALAVVEVSEHIPMFIIY